MTAVITGATGRLGRLIAMELAGRGIDLVIVGRDKERLLTVAQEIKSVSAAIRITPFEADLRNIGAIDEIASRSRDADILINAAAAQGPIGNSWETSAAEFEDVMRLNFLARSLPRNGSAYGRQRGGLDREYFRRRSDRPASPAYASAKTALVRFSETLASECDKIGVRVNCIAPGAFRSGMTTAIIEAGEIAGRKEIEVARRLMGEDSDAASRAPPPLSPTSLTGTAGALPGRSSAPYGTTGSRCTNTTIFRQTHTPYVVLSPRPQDTFPKPRRRRASCQPSL